jgi:DNA polymerase III alpha subunit
MNADRLIEFMQQLIKNKTQKLFLILDNLRVHHSKIAKEWVENNKDKIEPDNAEKIKDEFNVIRNTRNSFHNGGVYNRDFDEFKGVFLNEEYEFIPGQPV